MREIDAGCHQIDQFAGLFFEFAFSCDVVGPVGNERSRNSAFVYEMFVLAKRCVADIRPAFSISDIRVGRTGHHVFAVQHRPTITRATRFAPGFQCSLHPSPAKSARPLLSRFHFYQCLPDFLHYPAEKE